ncbi:MAG TPA: nickel pincer cofactor biosynthesis protein LarC [Methanoregulaceae archaeon]|nr:nickel pincer cofactor biosynthesis protein LarC [Methanoregulaceae archaeon]
MRVLIFDPFRGAAGDMITAALLHLDADRDLVEKAMSSVVGDPEFTFVNRAGIRAMKVNTNATSTQRTLEEVLQRVKVADAPVEAVNMAIKVFFRIADAEEKIHGSTPHFHEVGADDAVADVVGACTALFSLHIDGVVVQPVALGGGMLTGAHGTYPVPAPATLEIFRQSGVQVTMGTAEDGELCTPTGAALLAEFSNSFRTEIGEGGITHIGYGAGSKDNPTIPNVLRVMLMETSADPPCDMVEVLETNVDDVDGEVLSSALQRLMEKGARDVSAIPCIMKKGRGGFLVRVVSPQGQGGTLATLMAKELGTLGIRCIPSVHRFVAARSQEKVRVEIKGTIRDISVKYGKIGENIFSLKAEFDQVRDWARDLDMPVREVKKIVEHEAWKRVGQAS